MGMCLALTMADDESMAKVLVNPSLIWKLLAPDDAEIYAKEAPSGSWFSRLFGKQQPAPAIDDNMPQSIEDTDLDKAWHGIHYLLTGTAWEGDHPLNFLLLGGTEVGDIDVGYGTARALNSEVVKEIHRALADINEEILRRRFNPAEMTKLEIYPDIWDRDSQDDDTLGYCLEYFNELKAFIGRAAEKDLGVVISIQ